MTDDPTDVSALRAEVTALRGELAALREAAARAAAPDPTDPTDPTTDRHGSVTRRGLLAAAVAGGAGLVAGQVAAAAPAAANAGDPVVMGANNDAAGHVTIITSGAGRDSATLGVVNPDPSGSGIGLFAQLGNQSGMVNDGNVAAVVGDSQNGIGVSGLSATSFGVYALTTSQFDPAVLGSSANTTVVVGQTASDEAGVFGSSGGGPGVRGESFNAEGLLGQSTNGAGLVATAGSGSPGVDAQSAGGYGVQATGGLAPLRLSPASKPGKPGKGKHKLGELYVDSVGVLYLCTVAGTPGTWKKVALV